MPARAAGLAVAAHRCHPRDPGAAGPAASACSPRAIRSSTASGATLCGMSIPPRWSAARPVRLQPRRRAARLGAAGLRAASRCMAARSSASSRISARRAHPRAVLGRTTPARLAGFLAERGFGALAPHRAAKRWAGRASGSWTRQADGLRCGGRSIRSTSSRSRSRPTGARPCCRSPPGLPDDLFEHDGQITKREIRAITLSALAPRQGELLWDVGAGSGSVGIEWMLRHPAIRAIAIEARADRAARTARNAAALGVPDLEIVEGSRAGGARRPAAARRVFVGGGGTDPAVLDAAWAGAASGRTAGRQRGDAGDAGRADARGTSRSAANSSQMQIAARRQGRPASTAGGPPCR